MTDMDALAGDRTLTVCDLPDEIFAGVETKLGVEVTTNPPVDLTGQQMTLVDVTGRLVATAPLEPARHAERVGCTTVDLVFRAPVTPGAHRFALRLAPCAAGGVSFPKAEAEVPLSILAHRIEPVVWGVAEAVAPGAALTVHVGARCAAGCDTSGWEVTIHDGAGQALGHAAIGAETWPGTSGLRHAQVALTAPEAVGPVTWVATVETPRSELPHGAGRRSFGLRTVPAADASLCVEAVDAETGVPVPGLKVVVHPFTARTGDDGRAELELPTGSHRIFVSGQHYVSVRTERTIVGDETIHVEMAPDRGLSDAQIWG